MDWLLSLSDHMGRLKEKQKMNKDGYREGLMMESFF